jgi:hypothetical protein
VVEKDVTPFIKKFYAFKTIYTVMLSSFDNEDIVTIVSEGLKNFFEKFENFINTAPKMESENSLKQ